MPGIINEELLEPVARFFRFRTIIREMTKKRDIIVVDLGCGPSCFFYDYALRNGVTFRRYIGVDPLLATGTIRRHRDNRRVDLISAPLAKKLPLKGEIADYIIGSAFIEHVNFPGEIINDAIRILKKGGKIILSTPTHRAKWILELLSHGFGLLARREIEEHKNYFDGDELKSLVEPGQKGVRSEHCFFEFGLNNLFIVTRD